MAAGTGTLLMQCGQYYLSLYLPTNIVSAVFEIFFDKLADFYEPLLFKYLGVLVKVERLTQ